MNTNEVKALLQKALYDAALGVDIDWPNSPRSAVWPRIEVSHISSERTSGTLKGSEVIRYSGVMSAIIVTQAASGAVSGDVLADQVAAIFPEGSRIAITGGEIAFNRPADIRDGYNDDGDWRVPVMIGYSAMTT
jgi:hypothetical protein